VKITTNNVPRDVIDAWQLTAKEREEFDYLNWRAIDEGCDSASFVRYKGDLHDLGEFSGDWGIMKGSGLPDSLAGWHAYRSDSVSTATVIRYVDDDFGRVVVGYAVARG
jgi:hypothetical protein